MSVNIWLDETNSIAVVKSEGTSSGREVSRRIIQTVASRPELGAWHWIHDFREASGEVDLADIATVADAFQPAASPRGQAVTVFITFEPLWARTMDPLFPSRKHRVATSLEGAVALVLRSGPTRRAPS